MSEFGPLLTCVTSAQKSGLCGGADQRLMHWRSRLLTQTGSPEGEDRVLKMNGDAGRSAIGAASITERN